ncbi:MAG: hypothetical protein ACR2K3_07610 [Nocardioides sp.]
MHDSRVGDRRALHLGVLGVRLDILVSGSQGDALYAALSDAWSWCRAEADGEAVVELQAWLDDDPDRVPELTVDHQVQVVGGHDLASVMHAISPAVTQRAVAAQAGRLLMLHAAVVAHPDTGGCAVLIGASGAGKTTLATALGRHFAYLSDETAAIDSELGVMPYPKPLSVLTHPGAELSEQVDPGSAGLQRLRGATPRVRAVVLLHRDPGHAGLPVVEPVAIVDALPELAAQTFYSRRLDRPLHRLAELARAAGGVRRVTYAEAPDLVPVIDEPLRGGDR